jgi:O-antigen ligase
MHKQTTTKMRSWLASASVLLFPLVPATLVLNDRLNVAAIFIYGAVVLLQPNLVDRLRKLFRARDILPFALYYLLLVVSLLWTQDLDTGLYELEKKAALIALPVAIAIDVNFGKYVIRRSQIYLIAGTLVAVLICLISAVWQWFDQSEPSFFYHDFSAALGANAIYFSMFVFASILWLVYSFQDVFHGVYKWLILTFLALGLYLLSSRLFISLTVLSLTYYLVQKILESQKIGRQTVIAGAGIILLVLAVMATSRVKDRFEDLWSTDFAVLEMTEFTYDTPFSGLSLRLLLLKFGYQILKEHKAFLWGVGVGDAKNELDRLKIETKMYLGNPALGDSGYWTYKFHNQFMETWVQVGLLGLVIILYLFARGFIFSGRCSPVYFFILCGLFAFAATESTLERQKGLVFFVYFLTTLFYLKNERTPISS